MLWLVGLKVNTWILQDSGNISGMKGIAKMFFVVNITEKCFVLEKTI
jgi:hypothetical protein